MLKTLCLILLTTTTVFAQDNTVIWLNKNVHPLNTGAFPDKLEDLRFLDNLVSSKSIVGLGEASHGTSEFYIQKGRIVKYLVQEMDYRMIALEAADVKIEPLNSYIQNGQGDLRMMLKTMGLYNSHEMYLLCEWLMNFNKNKADKVALTGIDREEFWSDPMMRDEWMAGVFTEAHTKKNDKAIIWSHNLHIAKDTTMSSYKGMGYYLNQKFGNSFYVIGLDSYKGNVTVLNGGELERHSFEGNEGTFSSLLAECEYSIFFVDFATAGNPLTGKINKITNIYSHWQDPVSLPVKPGFDFDALIFIRETTGSVGLDR